MTVPLDETLAQVRRLHDWNGSVWSDSRPAFNVILIDLRRSNGDHHER
jgi:hypothetical protein